MRVYVHRSTCACIGKSHGNLGRVFPSVTTPSRRTSCHEATRRVRMRFSTKSSRSRTAAKTIHVFSLFSILRVTTTKSSKSDSSEHSRPPVTRRLTLRPQTPFENTSEPNARDDVTWAVKIGHDLPHKVGQSKVLQVLCVWVWRLRSLHLRVYWEKIKSFNGFSRFFSAFISDTA